MFVSTGNCRDSYVFLSVSEMLVEARVSNEPMLEILVVQKKQMRGERGTKSQVTFISITLLYDADRFRSGFSEIHRDAN